MVLSGHLGCPQAGTKGGKATHTWQVGPGVLQRGPGSCVKLKGHQVSVPAGRWRSVDINGHQRRSVPMSKAQQLKERPLTKPKGLVLSGGRARHASPAGTRPPDPRGRGCGSERGSHPVTRQHVAASMAFLAAHLQALWGLEGSCPTASPLVSGRTTRLSSGRFCYPPPPQ